MKAAAALVALALATAPAWANGAIAERKAGGIEFRHSGTVSITREDLFVSRKEVRVHYFFQSESAAAQPVMIAFPMPPVTVADDPDGLREILPEGAAPENYMNFKVSVNGKPVEAKPESRALLDGQDVSPLIAAAGLPLHLMPGGSYALLRALTDAQRQSLIAAGLLGGGEEGLWPHWQYQSIFAWEQSLPPGRTEVDIAYVPLAGYPSDIGDAYERGPLAEAACVDDVLRKAIGKRRAAGGYYEVATVGYVLTTARYWKGPIREFNLTVAKEAEDELVAYCPLEARKTSPRTFLWAAKDFVPGRDLSVIYYSFQTP